jgi:hypothetical protein
VDRKKVITLLLISPSLTLTKDLVIPALHFYVHVFPQTVGMVKEAAMADSAEDGIREPEFLSGSATHKLCEMERAT